MSKKLKHTDLKEVIATAEAELASLNRRVETLKEWLALTKRVGAHSSKETALPASVPVMRSRRTKTTGIAEHVLAILKDAGREMHVDEIVEKLTERSQLPNAKNPKATIAVALSRRPDEFQRSGPNTFSLASATPTPQAVTMAS